MRLLPYEQQAAQIASNKKIEPTDTTGKKRGNKIKRLVVFSNPPSKTKKVWLPTNSEKKS